MKGARARSREMDADNGTLPHALVVSELPSRIPVLAEELAIVRAHLGEAIDGILTSDFGEASLPQSKPVASKGRPSFNSTAPSHASQSTSVEQLVGGCTK